MAKSTDSLENLSMEEIQARLRNVDNDRIALQRALLQRRQQTRNSVVQEVKDLILSRGHDIADILSLCAADRKPNAKLPQPYTRYVDPKNPKHEYVRGVLPRWMKEQMLEQGFNPKDKADRRMFKEQLLRKK